jgi:uncharacterized Fe-S cluster protein YjdI
VRDSRGVLFFGHGMEFGYDDSICQHIDTCIRLETPYSIVPFALEN